MTTALLPLAAVSQNLKDVLKENDAVTDCQITTKELSKSLFQGDICVSVPASVQDLLRAHNFLTTGAFSASEEELPGARECLKMLGLK